MGHFFRSLVCNFSHSGVIRCLSEITERASPFNTFLSIPHACSRLFLFLLLLFLYPYLFSVLFLFPYIYLHHSFFFSPFFYFLFFCFCFSFLFFIFSIDAFTICSLYIILFTPLFLFSFPFF